MGLYRALLAIIFAAQLLTVSFGAPLVETRDNVCSNGIYGELSPILKQYPIAVAWCSAFYPVSCSSGLTKRAASSTMSTTSTASTASNGVRVQATASSGTIVQTTAQTARTTKSNSPVSSTTTAAVIVDLKVSALSKATRQPGNVVRTLCSCIETPKVIPIG